MLEECGQDMINSMADDQKNPFNHSKDVSHKEMLGEHKKNIINRETHRQIEIENWLVNLERQTMTETGNLVRQFLMEIQADKSSDDFVKRIMKIMRNT